MSKEKREYQVIHVPDDASNRTLYRSKHIGRNELCPCGSGKKNKKCCGNDATYKFRRNVRTVVPESDLMLDKRIADKIKSTGRNFILTQFSFNIGQSVMLNERYPDKNVCEKETTIIDRGLDNDAYNPYYKIDIEGLENRWVAEYCLSLLIK